MPYDNVLAEARNTFPVSPSRDQLITLTIGQLQDLIREAIQPLQDEVESFRATTITSLDTKVSALESTQDTHAENSFIQLRLINELRETAKKKPGKITANQENRIKILRALLAAHNGKMLTKEARQIMKMDKGAFSRLVDAMPEYIETKPYSLNKRQTILVLKSRSIVDDNDQRLS
jgi:hypothetical protein